MPTDERTFITLHDGVPDHPKIEPLSDKAFRLWVETICWCSRHLTDGWVPATTWRRRGTPAVRRELAAAGLLEDHGDYVRVHDYLDHQRSAQQVAERREVKRRAGAKGNHDRWHVGPKGKPQPDCPLCHGPGPGSRNGSHLGSQVRSQPGSQTDRSSESDRYPTESPEVEEFLRNSCVEVEAESDSVGARSEGGSRTEAAQDQPPQGDRTEGPVQRCGQRHRHRDPCGECKRLRTAGQTDPHDSHRAQVVASLPTRRCRMCDADGQLLEVGRFVPVSPSTRCDHRTDHATQVRRAAEAS